MLRAADRRYRFRYISGDTEMLSLIEIAAATLVFGYAATYLTMRHFFPPARS
jgi:hypothetical protein